MKTPDLAVGGIVAGVFAYDMFCREGETISERVDDYLEHPLGKTAVYAVVGTVALHLCNFISPQYDPIHHLASRRKRRGTNTL